MFSIFGLTSPWQNKNTMCIFIENMSMFSNPKAQINCTVFYIQTDNTHRSFKITTLFIPKSPGRNYAKQRQQSTLSTEMFILLFSMLASNYHETNRRLKKQIFYISCVRMVTDSLLCSCLIHSLLYIFINTCNDSTCPPTV